MSEDISWEQKKPPGILKKPGKNTETSFNAPEGLWKRCPNCQSILSSESVEKNNFVCIECSYHFRISARDRINIFVDSKTFQENNINLTPKDPLKFKDLYTYPERVKKSKIKSGELEAIITGKAKLFSRPILVGAFEFKFMGGSMGVVVGEKIARLFELGAKTNKPVIIFSASGGARMQEGILSLMQMAKTIASLNKLADKKLPFISVLCDPTTGGVSASFSSLGDICIAEPKATIGFAGKRVIEQTIRQTLPEGFQTAEFLLKHGMIDDVIERNQIKEYISETLDLLLGPIE